MQALMFDLFVVSGCFWLLRPIAIIICSTQFDRNCMGHLKRAANASTVELAARELSVALRYLQTNGLTRGYTSVFYKTPDEDIGHWYRNLKGALAELEDTRPDAPAAERNSLLLKLRGTILDRGSNGGDQVTVPEGISLYPHNALFGLWGVVSFVLLIVFMIAAIITPYGV